MIKLLGQLDSQKDRIKKWVFVTDNNEIIEISLISNKSQDILYIPTHYNCSLGCHNCTLNNVCQDQELKLIKYEELMAAIEEVIIPWDTRLTNNMKILVSFRGVGEPLLNMPLIENMYKGKLNFERLGYTKIAFEVSTMMPNENLSVLSELVNKGKYPIRVIYRMSSPVDDKRKVLAPATDLSVDSSLVYLHKFNENIKNNLDIKRMYREHFASKSPVEIYYDIIPGVNDTSFELAILQYFGGRYNIPINFAKSKNGEEKWKEDIMSHYPELRVTLTKIMGADIGSSHGKFAANLYSGDDATDNVIDYLRFQADDKKCMKKVLENKVV